MASRDKFGRSYGTGRTRNYATVVYQESAPENWQTILSDLLISAFISPYHDQDKNPDGEPKKPHWHVMIMFDTVKTKEQATEIFDKIGGVGCEVINSMRGYARYLCHLDNPDKHQYDKKEVVCFAGADYENVIGLASDKYTALIEMINFCIENDIYNYDYFVNWVCLNRLDWFKVIADTSSAFMERYIRHRYFTRRDSLSGSSDSWKEQDDFVSYLPLFRFLEQHKMKKTDLLEVISRKTLAKLSKGISVDFRTVQKLCDFLNCQPGDIMEFAKESDPVPEAPETHPADDAAKTDLQTAASGDAPDPDVEVPEESQEIFVGPPKLPRADMQLPKVGNRYSRRHPRKKPKGPGGGKL